LSEMVGSDAAHAGFSNANSSARRLICLINLAKQCGSYPLRRPNVTNPMDDHTARPVSGDGPRSTPLDRCGSSQVSTCSHHRHCFCGFAASTPSPLGAWLTTVVTAMICYG
jgi:hypothetical protein